VFIPVLWGLAILLLHLRQNLNKQSLKIQNPLVM
jgi:hypothetical protein